MTARTHWQSASLHLFFFFRFVQLGAVVVASFAYCYLVWQHNNHYCAYYPLECTRTQLRYVKVLWEYKLVITACTLALLESYISTTIILHQQRMPNYRRLLITTTPVISIISGALGTILRNPSTSKLCFFFLIPLPLRSNVEEKYCVIVVSGYVSLSIATGFTGFIFLMSAIITFSDAMRKRRIMLPTENPTAQPVANEVAEEGNVAQEGNVTQV